MVLLLQRFESVVKAVDREEATEITAEQKTALQGLWSDSGVQKCFERRNEFQISDSAK